MRIFKKLTFSLPKPIVKIIYNIYYYFRYHDQIEQTKCFGQLNPHETFYVIRPRKDCVEGLMSLFVNVLKQLLYAQAHNYIPVVDFENYPTQYQDSKDCNIWENYFAQPSPYSLHEVYQSKNVILSGLSVLNNNYDMLRQSYDNDQLLNLHNFISRSIQFKRSVLDCVEDELNHIDVSHSVGLYLRGTDYMKLRPAGHPVQPTVEQAVEVVNQYLEKYDLDSIFLVTEDYTIYQNIVSVYGDKVHIPSYDVFVKDYHGVTYLSKDNCIRQLSDSAYLRGLNYLCKLIILSKCSYLVGGNTNGSWMACAFSKGYKDRYIFDLGKY